MDAVEISNLINATVSGAKTAFSSIEGLLAWAVALIVTAQKLSALLASKKSYSWNLVPGRLPTLKLCRAA